MAQFKDDIVTTKADWTAKLLCEYADQGTVRFDNVIQRDYVWKRKQDSLLIDSLMRNYSPPKFIANKKGDTFDMVDGKQRHHAISSYISNKFKLTGLADRIDTDGNVHVLNDKYFKDLDEGLQDKIKNRSLEITVMDNATQEQVKEYFFRINNGTSLTAARKTFSKAKSFEEISLMALHPIFRTMFSTKTNGDDSKGLVMRSYVILYCENKSLENRKVFSYIERTAFTEEGIAAIKKCYDTLVEVYEMLRERDEKQNKKIMKRMMTKTHTITLIPIVKFVNESNIDLEVFANWLEHFFSSQIKATISEVYNENATTGSSKVGAVEARLKAMTDDFMEFIAK